MSADYLGAIAWNLNIKVDVYYFANADEAMAALKANNIDLIAHASTAEAQAGLLLSDPYVNNTVALVSNNNPQAKSAKKLKVTITENYRDDAQLKPYYANADIINFSTQRHALEALSFHQIDLYIGDATTAQYLINQSNLSDLSLSPLHQLEQRGFSFATTQNNTLLIRILNKALQVIPENIRADISRRWSGGIPLSSGDRHLVFTSLEQKWIAEHPEITVAVAEDMAPLNFFDSDGKLYGITADVLAAIESRIGIRFTIERQSTLQEALKTTRSGSTGIIAGITFDSVWPNNLLTTRSYLFNSWVMVGKKNSRASTLPKVVAVLAGQYPIKDAATDLYDANILQAKNYREGLEWVKEGRAERMILPLTNAKFMVSHYFHDSLRIVSSFDSDPARFVLAVSERDYPLVTILDKAILNILPEDLHAMTRNGYALVNLPDEDNSGVEEMQVASVWRNTSFVLLALLLLFILYQFWRYRQRNQLRQRDWQTLIDAIPAPVYLADATGQIVVANPPLLTALQRARPEVLGQRIPELLAALQDATATSSQHTGHPRALKRWQAPLDSGSALISSGYIGGWLDMTDNQRRINALRQAKRSADQASHAKSQFLATMSHEIRTPMSAIAGILELVLRRNEITPNINAIRLAHQSAQSLLILIGDILDIARIESERLVLNPERANIYALVESVAALFDGLARQKSLQFRLEIATDANVDVLIDPLRFKQILSNVLSNAIKFTTQGQISLRVSTESHDASSLNLLLVVQDSGCGIDQATQARLFKRFEQAQGTPSLQGSGLGLYICKTLSAMMGGDITLQSEAGIGTEVTVRLRLPELARLDSPLIIHSAAAPPPTPLQILIVEDNPASRMLLNEQLCFLGHQTQAASQGIQALALLDQQDFDLMITDCNMPEMDGYALTRLVRQREQKTPPLIIWGLTANALPEAVDSCLASGMDACLFKPIGLDQLAEKLTRVSCRTSPQQWHYFSPQQIAAELKTPANLPTFIRLQIDELEAGRNAMTSWLDQQDDNQLKAALHKLRGGITLIGAQQLIACCLQAEQDPQPAGIVALIKMSDALEQELTRWRARTTSVSEHPTAQ
nr:transporter substrate-binding domain-containing protein [Pantoea sp. 201603H]